MALANEYLDKLVKEMNGLDDEQTEKLLWWISGAASILKIDAKERRRKQQK